jgi:hypothetical protein
MKKILALLVGLVCQFQVSVLSAQTTCLDFTNTTTQYLTDISYNNGLYPIGSILFQIGDIKIKKVDSMTFWINAHSDTACFVGKIELNVSSASFTQRVLTFSTMATQGLIVDNDTIFSMNNPPALYNGVGFTVTYAANTFTVTGVFDWVQIFGSTNCIGNICLSPQNTSTQTCADFTGTTPQYLQDITVNNSLYPIGTVVFQTGDIKFRKAGVPCQFISASGDTLCYIGKIEMDISSAPYPQRQLTFYSIITQGMIVDGDTIFQNSNPPSQYNGIGFSLAYLNNTYTITGAFDTVHIFGSTNCLSAVCLTPDTVSTQSCADFTGTTPQYLQDISINNTLYPIGTVVFQTGDIKFRKAGVPCQFISASGDTLCYIGKIEMDITSAPYPQRQLTFYSIITQGMIVDGDTIFQNSNPVPQYNGVGFTVNYLNNIFTITGAFDTVHIFGSTNCLSAVCLSSIPTQQESELLNVQDIFELYPNPAENEFVVTNDSEQSADLRVFSIQGELIYSTTIPSGKTPITINQFQSGIYFVQLATQNGLLYSKRLVVRK